MIKSQTTWPLNISIVQFHWHLAKQTIHHSAQWQCLSSLSVFVCVCMFSGSAGLELSSHEFGLFSHCYAEKNHLSLLRCTLSLYSPHMASVEHKQEKQEPFYLGCGSRRQTSAEIVTEARHSLRTLRTKQPFTPREEHRQLFGGSARKHDGRPPSSFRF